MIYEFCLLGQVIRFGQHFFTSRRGRVMLAYFYFNHLVLRYQLTLLFQLKQNRIQGSWAEIIPLCAQLIGSRLCFAIICGDEKRE